MYKVLLLSSLLLMSSFQDAKKTILFYGDSITAGYGLDTNSAYPAEVKRLLSQQGFNIEVINAGLSGETSAGGVGRINWILKRPVDIFVLELGANDGLRGLPLEQTKNNLQKIIDEVKKKNPSATIVVAGMMVPPNMGKDYSDGFKQIFKELAQKNNAILIPFLLDKVAGNPELNISDGIHPNAEGHKIVARTVATTLKPLL